MLDNQHQHVFAISVTILVSPSVDPIMDIRSSFHRFKLPKLGNAVSSSIFLLSCNGIFGLEHLHME